MAHKIKPMVLSAISGGKEFCEKNPNLGTYLSKDRFSRVKISENPVIVEANPDFPGSYVRYIKELVEDTGKIVCIDFVPEVIDLLVKDGKEVALVLPSEDYAVDFPEDYEKMLEKAGFWSRDNYSAIKAEVSRFFLSENIPDNLEVFGLGELDTISSVISGWPQEFFTEISPSALVSAEKRMDMMTRLAESLTNEPDHANRVFAASFMVDKIINETYSTYVQ